MVEVRLRVLCSLFAVLMFSQVSFAGPIATEEKPQFVPGEILVKFKRSVGMNTFMMSNLHQVTGAAMIHEYKNIKGLHHIVMPNIDVREAVAYYSQHPLVEYAEPNYIVSITLEDAEARRQHIPNDEHFSKLWGLHNTGQKDPAGQEGVEDVDIDAPEAWDITMGSEDIIVAIIDTGIDYTHTDLAANIWTNTGETDGNNIDDDNNGFVDDIHGYDFANGDGDPIDDHGHGTHVAGTIVAVGDNEIGVIGVAPKVKVMGIKFLGPMGSGSISDAVLGIDYATQMGAHILNNSWGGGGFSQALYDAIENANAKNIVFTAAAGNRTQNNDNRAHYPSSYENTNVIAVAAYNNQDILADFSSYGPTTVHVAAPGDAIFSTVLDNEYGAFRGTSMATPHVSGIVALLLSEEPNLTPAEVKARLVSTSIVVPQFRRQVIAEGRVNAYNALMNIEPPSKEPQGLSWEEVAHAISTPHDYGSNVDSVWTITHAGATYIRVHFSKFDTEERYDIVRITDKDGNVADRIDGTYGDALWSYSVPGDTINIRLTSDGTLQRYGFDIDKYAYSLE